MKSLITFLSFFTMFILLTAQVDHRPSGLAKATGNVLGTLILFGIISIVAMVISKFSGKNKS